MPEDQTDAQPGDPAKAFEDLRAEVSVLRKAVEALPRAIRDSRPPDYTQDIAVLGKGLDEIGSQLETIQQSPALRMTPEQQGQSIANAGNAIFREAAQKLERAAQEADHERYNLSNMIGTIRAKSDQRFMVIMAAAFALFVGLIISPMLARIMPFGISDYIASRIMGADEWNAGIALLNNANPDLWAQIVADSNLADANRDKITACQKDAAKAKKDERCTITVKAVGS
jgi:hypothetical protein